MAEKTYTETMHLEEAGLHKDGAADHVANEPLSPEEDKRILRKIDKCLLPMMAVSYMFQFLDKSALSYTAIMGLREDLNLSGNNYSWANGIYYIGYLVASYPAGLIMIRFPVARFISSSILAWGGILMFTALCKNSNGLLANRFFLGFSEAAIAPGLSVVVAMWYKRSEQPLRHGAWFLGNTSAGIFGGITAYGIGHIKTIAPWKAVFLIFGGVSVLWSFALFYLLPDVPMEARFLNATDRLKAVQRVEENMTGIKSDKFKWYQCREALIDPKAWALLVIQLSSNIANGGVHGFGSIIVEGMGFSTFNTLLLNMLSSVFQTVFVIIAATGSTYFRNTRTYFMTWNLVVSIVGVTMIRQLPQSEKWARLFGFCLTLAYTANFPLILAMSSGNFGGFTKKTTVNAMIFIGYCTGNIIGPQLFFAWEAPHYTSGFLAIMICFAIATVCCIALRFYLIWENKQRDGVGGVLEAEYSADTTVNLMDKTDMEIPQFRYVY